MEQERDGSIFSFTLDFQNTAILKSAASWARMLSILGFILAILSILVAVKMPSTMNAAPALEGYGDANTNAAAVKMAGTIGLITYVVMGVIFAISSILSLSFARKANMALTANDPVTLTAAFNSLKSFFIFWSILSIILVLVMLISVAGFFAI